jgi:hypothetical protein
MLEFLYEHYLFCLHDSCMSFGTQPQRHRRMKRAQKSIREPGIEPIDRNVGCKDGVQYCRNGRDG